MPFFYETIIFGVVEKQENVKFNLLKGGDANYIFRLRLTSRSMSLALMLSRLS